MKITIAKSAGFCFGVKRALKIALQTASENKKAYMLGDIVHNEAVTRQINKAGIKKIRNLSSGKNRVLLLRAHGTTLSAIQKARGLGYRVVDATCPMVKEIHKIAKDIEKKGWSVIIIGNKKHDEVLGIIGQLRTKAIVIDRLTNIPWDKIKEIKKIGVVVQSTQNIEQALKIASALKSKVRFLKFFNTVCLPTRIKQEEIKKMPRKNQAMVIIGSKNSANTKRLYEISKAINSRTYWINSKKELKRGWFKEINSVGITAGASTPQETTQSVVEYLKSI
jgi:4-hydroxy-3-methylbut-2-enyl diphosphate reductase